MLSRRSSIALVVSAVLTTVLTLSLAIIATVYFAAERGLQLRNVRQAVELNAEQLSSGLASSLWNFDFAQVDRIIAGVAEDQDIYAIVVTPLDATASSPVRVRAVVRDAQWRVQPAAGPVDERGYLAVERDIRVSGQVIGSVKVLGTPRFALARLRERSLAMSGGIALLDVILISALYALLWKTVIKPLKTIEKYSVSVRSGADVPAGIQSSGFRGELHSLAASIEGMVGLLHSRYLELQASQAALRLVRFAIERSSDGMFLIRPDGSFADVNEAACRELGYTRGELLALDVPAIDVVINGQKWLEVWEELRGLGFMAFETLHRAKDGREIPVEISSNYFVFERQEYTCSFARDLSARKQADADKVKLEAQLMQAQRMESVGRLAGGVAHDFNNMLGAIFGHTELAELALGEDPARLQGHLKEIAKAARRSASLTQQLLAFARKQTIAPRVLDLNETIEGVLKMLKRLIGEDIQILWLPGPGLWPVLADPSQVDQMLANLCVNARDAIANVGRITIETGNRVFDADYCATHVDCALGEFVRVAVSDNGCGIGKEVLPQIFEPFFTTKGTGMGTGLGLSTVYGAVKQNGGFINVYSEVDQGTTFSIYLPRHEGVVEKGPLDGAQEVLRRGHETILVVEDETAILGVTRTMLERQGYTVLAANSPAEAVRLAREHVGQVHLLVTDIVMPEMNGRELAKYLTTIYPQLRLLFMSGYTASVIAHHGVLDTGVPFIQKPFSMKELTAKVRETLD